MPGLVKSSVFIAILKPSPSSPSRYSTGTRTSWNASAEVSVARCPILSRCFSTVTPGNEVGTMNAVSPRWPWLLSVEAKTTSHSALPAFVMNIFEPLMTYSSPSWTAVVWMPETSEPAFGSLSPKEQRIGLSISGGSHSCFCSSLPAIITGAAPRVLATIETAIPAQPQESSSPTSMPSKPGRPSPPYSSGMCGFIRPTSWALAMMSSGWVECSSYSAAFGRISFSANSRASCRSSRCSSLSANEMPVALDCSITAIVCPRSGVD